MNRYLREWVFRAVAVVGACGLLSGPLSHTADAQRKPPAKKNNNRKPNQGNKNKNNSNQNNQANRAREAAAKQKQALIKKINAHIKSATTRAKAAEAAAKRAAGPVQAAKSAHEKAQRDLKAARERVESVEEYLFATAGADTPLGKARLAYADAKDNYEKVKVEVLASLGDADAVERIKAVNENPKIQEAKKRLAAAGTPMRKERDKVFKDSDKWTSAKHQVKMLGTAERDTKRDWKAQIASYSKAKAAYVAASKNIAEGKRALASANAIRLPPGGQDGKGNNNNNNKKNKKK